MNLSPIKKIRKWRYPEPAKRSKLTGLGHGKGIKPELAHCQRKAMWGIVLPAPSISKGRAAAETVPDFEAHRPSQFLGMEGCIPLVHAESELGTGQMQRSTHAGSELGTG
eukprot:1045937-Pelagomonas_calceolata.AAC.4